MRDRSVDFAEGIAMIAVSFGHVMPVLCGRTDFLSKYAYSFELAVFFIASGYLQFGRSDQEPSKYIKHKVLSLLYPYVTFTLITLLFDGLLSVLANGFISYLQSIPLRVCSAVTWGVGACWFLPTFFISSVIVCLCRTDKRIPDRVKTTVLIVVGSVMCYIAEKHGYLKDVTRNNATTFWFWLWHLFSLISRSVAGASLVMIGRELKRFAFDKKVNRGGMFYHLC